LTLNTGGLTLRSGSLIPLERVLATQSVGCLVEAAPSWMLWGREYPVVSARHRTTFTRLSSPLPSHDTSYTIPAPCCTRTCKIYAASYAAMHSKSTLNHGGDWQTHKK